MKRIKRKLSLTLILMAILTTVIGLTYGVFTVSTSNYTASEMLISNLMYGISITSNDTNVDINDNTVSLNNNTSTILVKITSLNPIDSNYSLEYKITEGTGNVYYASNTGWLPTGKISKDGGLVYVKTVKVVIETTSNITVEFNVNGGYTYNDNIIALTGYTKITNVYDKTQTNQEETNLK